jgi:tetratricopeptide (TPR) repeat protein
MPALPVKRLDASVLSILVSCCFLLSQQPLCAEDFTAAFDAANKLYAEGKFAEAAGAYEQILNTGSASTAVYFNLGNAFFKSSQIGRAIAAYRQAEQCSPRDPDVLANLQFARNQVQGPTWRAGRGERWLGRLSLNEWTWLGAGAVWVLFVLLTVQQVWPALARPLRSWTVGATVMAVLLIGCFVGAHAANSRARTAIVIAPEAAVRSGPFEESPNTFTARDGAELRVLDRKGEWLQVTDGTRRVGWVKQDAVVIPMRT